MTILNLARVLVLFDISIACSTTKSHRSDVSHKGLTSIPHNLPNKAGHTINLESNLISHIEYGQLDYLLDIRSLLLNNNTIRLISDGSFKGLLHLFLLDLSHNLITTVSHKTFNGLRRLVHLKLLKNRITHLRKDSFTPLVECINIALQGNLIVKIEAHCHVGLGKLEELHLDVNR